MELALQGLEGGPSRRACSAVSAPVLTGRTGEPGRGLGPPEAVVGPGLSQLWLLAAHPLFDVFRLLDQASPTPATPS